MFLSVEAIAEESFSGFASAGTFAYAELPMTSATRRPLGAFKARGFTGFASGVGIELALLTEATAGIFGAAAPESRAANLACAVSKALLPIPSKRPLYC